MASFRGEKAFLSNFYPCKILMRTRDKLKEIKNESSSYNPRA